MGARGRTAQVLVSMVASLANSAVSNPSSIPAGKRKALAYKRLGHKNKAVASHTHSKIVWSAQTCLRLVLGLCSNAKRAPALQDGGV